jgi:hypothetical protein
LAELKLPIETSFFAFPVCNLSIAISITSTLFRTASEAAITADGRSVTVIRG